MWPWSWPWCPWPWCPLESFLNFVLIFQWKCAFAPSKVKTQGWNSAASAQVLTGLGRLEKNKCNERKSKHVVNWFNTRKIYLYYYCEFYVPFPVYPTLPGSLQSRWDEIEGELFNEEITQQVSLNSLCTLTPTHCIEQYVLKAKSTFGFWNRSIVLILCKWRCIQFN